MSNGRYRCRWIRFLIVFFLSAPVLPAAGYAQQTQGDAEGNWKQICASAKAQPLITAQPTEPLSAERLANCDETALYYGLGNKPDYAAALQCGWYQRMHPQHAVGNMFYGPGVLAMLYANGKGVPRNYDLAIRFACEDSWAAEAEMANRIGHLEHLRDTGSQQATFDLCDDAMSGLSDGSCTSISTRAAGAIRSRKIAHIVDMLSERARSAFPPLQSAESSFEQARIDHEIDLSGTSRAAFQLREEAKLRDQFLIDLQRFGKGDIPPASEAELSLYDKKLSEIYLRIEHARAGNWEFGTVKPEGIRETERRWISLTDAWIAFARIAYPNLSTPRIRVQLIRLRIHQLRSINDELR
jgi:hypothetical protein